MPIMRIYDLFPSLTEIQKTPGPFIVEESPSGGVVAAKVGKVAIVCETLKGAPNVPVEILGGADLMENFGGFNKYVGDGAAAGHPYDGNLNVALQGHGFAGSYIVVSVDDRVGTVSLARESPGYAMATSTVAGPWALADTDTFIVSDDVGADGTATIKSEKTSSECVNSETFNFTAAAVLTMQVNGGPLQSYDLTADAPLPVNIAAVTAIELRDWINANFTGVSAAVTGVNQVTVYTDRQGTGATLLFGGTARAIAGWPAATVTATPANNNVVDVDAVTCDEMVGLINTACGRSTASNVGGLLRITRDTQGAAYNITLAGTLPGVSPVGKIYYTSLGPISGGTSTAPAGVWHAGYRISDGGANVFMLAEDVSFTAGTLTATGVAIKQASGTTVGINAITTVVDTPDTALFTNPTISANPATSAKPATEAGWTTVYTTALATLLADQSPERNVTIVVSTRHGSEGTAIAALTGSLQAALKAHCIASTAAGYPRWYAVSPPLATTKTIARGSSGIGVSSSTAAGRYKRGMYNWPGIRKFMPEIVIDDPTLDGYVDWTSDIAAASKASLLDPEYSLAQPGTELNSIVSLESYYLADGTGGALTPADYISNIEYGICSPRIDPDLGPKLHGQSMSVSPVTAPSDVPCSDRRMRDWLYRSLLTFAGRYQSKLNTLTRRRAFGGDISAWLEGLVQLERIAAYLVKEDTPTSMVGQGVVIFKVGVRTADHLDNIGFRVTAGRTVDVTAL